MAVTAEGVGMTSSGSTLLRYLGRHLLATFKTDHGRAIDRYIDYFGDCAATGTPGGAGVHAQATRSPGKRWRRSALDQGPIGGPHDVV